MELLIEVVSWVCLAGGSFFVLVGGFGVVVSESVVAEGSSLLFEEVSETLSLDMSIETAPGSR